MTSPSGSTGDGYLNPFHVYGSSHQEDNLTRAWLTTLQSLAPAHARLFVRDVLLNGRPELQSKINFSAASPLQFDFQIDDVDGETPDLSPDQGALVTIDASGDEELSFSATSPEGNARPDGLIVDRDSGVTLIIEVKLFGGQQPSQLSRHHNVFFDSSASTPEEVRTAVGWTDAADYLDQLRDRGTSEHERYMLTSFVEYAEHLGLAPFRGFRRRHFQIRDGTTLRKYMRAVNSGLHSSGIDSEWDEDKPNRMFFPERRDNLYIRYDGTENFAFGIVSGSGSKSTCGDFKTSVRERNGQIRAAGQIPRPAHAPYPGRRMARSQEFITHTRMPTRNT